MASRPASPRIRSCQGVTASTSPDRRTPHSLSLRNPTSRRTLFPTVDSACTCCRTRSLYFPHPCEIVLSELRASTATRYTPCSCTLHVELHDFETANGHGTGSTLDAGLSLDFPVTVQQEARGWRRSRRAIRTSWGTSSDSQQGGSDRLVALRGNAVPCDGFGGHGGWPAIEHALGPEDQHGIIRSESCCSLSS